METALGVSQIRSAILEKQLAKSKRFQNPSDLKRRIREFDQKGSPRCFGARGFRFSGGNLLPLKFVSIFHFTALVDQI